MAAERHAQCIPEYATTNPVPMPSTSNYNRDMAIGVDKSEFLKIVYNKEELARFGTLIKLKKRQVLKRAGATTARELYDSHLRTSQSLPQLSSRAGPATNRSRVSAGHFLADTQPKSISDSFPKLASTNDPALRKAKARASRRRRRKQREKLLASGVVSRGRGRGAALSVTTHGSRSSYGSYATDVSGMTGASGMTGVSFRFGGKGRVASNEFMATGFPSEKAKEREATDGITQEMIDSFGVSVGNKWDPARTKQYIEARQELLNDEETKAEITKLGERREVLVHELEKASKQIHDLQIQAEEEKKKKPKLKAIDPFASDSPPTTQRGSSAVSPTAATTRENNQEPAEGANTSRPPLSHRPATADTYEGFDLNDPALLRPQIPPFIGEHYKKGMKSTTKEASKIPFEAPQTSRIVAGRWRKKNESMLEAEYGFYSPPGETPFFLKGLGSRDRENPRVDHFMSRLHSMPHTNLYPLFSKK